MCPSFNILLLFYFRGKVHNWLCLKGNTDKFGRMRGRIHVWICILCPPVLLKPWFMPGCLLYDLLFLKGMSYQGY